MDSEEYFFNKILNDDFFKNALFVASPELYDTIYQSEDIIQTLRRDKKLKLSVLKYAIRATTRSTPFGMFAGIDTIHLADKTQMIINDLNNFNLHCRIDTEIIHMIIDSLQKHKPVAKHLLFYPNSTIYKLGGDFRYIESIYVKQRRKYKLTSIDENALISLMLQSCCNGLKIEDLARIIVDEEITVDEAIEFTLELIDNQIFVSELELSTTGNEMYDQLFETIKKITTRDNIQHEEMILFNKILLDLQNLRELLKEISNTEPAKNLVDKYLDVINAVDKMFNEVNRNNVIQTDLGLSMKSSSLDAAVLKDLTTAINVAKRFSTKVREPKLMDSFISAFKKRYETREVFLAEALDVETGIGYGDYLNNTNVESSEILHGLAFKGYNSEESTIKLNKHSNYWMRKTIECLRNGHTSIEITENDYSRFEDKDDRRILSRTFSVGVSLLKEKNNDNRVLEMKFCGGATASLWLGRFCYVNKDIHDLTSKICVYEQDTYEDAIVAEINHLPQDRLGNVIQRPALRNFEIPYFAKSFLEKECQISINDLMISIVNDKVVLKSNKLNKEVKPYCSNAHAYHINSLPIYYFLADLQQQDDESGAFGIDLQSCMKFFDFMPRVKFRNIILNTATWLLDYQVTQTILKADDPKSFFQSHCSEKLIPRYILLCEGDNQLLLDRNNDLCLDILINTLKKNKGAILKESLVQDYDSLLVDNKNEGYNNEVIFSFGSEKVENKSLVKFNRKLTDHDVFIPGESWIYYKIYGGYKVNDTIICEIQNILQSLIDQNVIDKWFFIRYYDPSSHLRLRLHFVDQADVGLGIAPITEFLNAYVKDGRIWDVSINTYLREMERYGVGGIDHVETLFHLDSKNCVETIRFLTDSGTDNLRWLAALFNIDSYLSIFGFNAEEKHSYLKSYIDNNEEYKSSSFRKSVQHKYNIHRKEIEELFTGGKENSNIHELICVLTAQQERLTPMLEKIRENAKESSNSILLSLIHMSVNRMMRSKNLKFEYVLFGFLESYYFQTNRKAKLKQKV